MHTRVTGGSDERADTPASAIALFIMGMRACTCGGKEDTEGAPTWRQRRCTNNNNPTTWVTGIIFPPFSGRYHTV